MRIADLIRKKKIRVRARVPAKLQKKLGADPLDGYVLGLVMKKGITWVRVKILKGPEQNFRPQDLNPR